MRYRHYLAYAAIALPLAFLGLPLYVYVPTVYAELPGIGLGLAGAVLFGARLLDLVTDPAVGLACDRWRPRVHPLAWIALGVPLMGVGVHALFNPPADAGALYLALTVSVTYLGWTPLAIPYYAWGAELARTAPTQRRLAAWREAGILGGALAALLVAALAASPLQAMSLAVLLLLPLGLGLLLLLPREPAGAVHTRPSLADAWRHTGPAMRRLLGLHFLNVLAAGMPATLFLMYTAQVLGMSSQASGGLLLLYFICGLLALPLWVRLAGRVGEVRAWQAAILLAALGFLPAAFLGAGDAAWFVAVCVFTGATLGADIALPAAMQSRLANADSRRAGHARAAASFGLWGMAGKLALACAVGVTLPLLELFPAGEARSAALPWVYALAPVVVKLLAAYAVQRSRTLLVQALDDQTHAEVVDEKDSLVADRAAGVVAERL